MELRHLRYFVAVAQELSFTKAAQRLHIAQPALSRQIRQLEDEMGVVLLERDRRSTRLTETGQAFLTEACALLAQSERAVHVAQKVGRAGFDRLNLGYVWGLFHSVAPNLIAQFRQRFPEVSVNLFDLTAIEQAEALRDGRLDAGLIGFALEADAAKLAKRKIGSCTFVAALPRNHWAARKSKVALSALVDDFFLMISEASYPGASRVVAEACRQAGFRPKILQAVERGYTIVGLVAAGCGVALLPEPVSKLPHDGVVFRALADPPRGDLFLAWSAARRLASRDAFLSLFLEMM
jgi:DNA-binding transcriptional LysR family regulator